MGRGDRGEPRTAVVCDGGGVDPRVTALSVAVIRLRNELAGFRAELPDRAIAEEELAGLAELVRELSAPGGRDEDTALGVARMRGRLLLVAAVVGSVRALSGALTELRRAVELFGGPPISDD
jgi:hypothetical protein